MSVSCLLFLLVVEDGVEELQDELLLFLWLAFYFLKSTLKRRNGSGLFLIGDALCKGQFANRRDELETGLFVVRRAGADDQDTGGGRCGRRVCDDLLRRGGTAIEDDQPVSRLHKPNLLDDNRSRLDNLVLRCSQQTIDNYDARRRGCFDWIQPCGDDRIPAWNGHDRHRSVRQTPPERHQRPRPTGPRRRTRHQQFDRLARLRQQSESSDELRLRHAKQPDDGQSRRSDALVHV